jgi:hypothetical protein
MEQDGPVSCKRVSFKIGLSCAEFLKQAWYIIFHICAQGHLLRHCAINKCCKRHIDFPKMTPPPIVAGNAIQWAIPLS